MVTPNKEGVMLPLGKFSDATRDIMIASTYKLEIHTVTIFPADH